ncbi:MAG: dihydroorotate dehydrogenase electron transfer subunit [Acidobacteriia bacterium]|nr:dihydroorotate dehydrogenase electron transfer subunit [Terriglobia bacterium]
MPQDLSAAVARNLDLGHGHFLLEFLAPRAAAEMVPGQFFMIGISGAEVLLRRPFSVCGLPGTFDDAPEGAVQVLYKVIGRGTALLSSLKPGAPITALGPLGRGFDLSVAPGVRPLLVAGGIGSAPFPALVSALAARGVRSTLVFGARNAGDLPLLDWFGKRCDEVTVATEDGSLGCRGLVTAPLTALLEDAGAVRIYGCGPNPMLRAVAEIAASRGIPCELSLEAHMACGFGVCLGCVVPIRSESGEKPVYERVCVEGPVMRAEKLAW